ncbi:cytochrome c oxidase assembly protein COX19-like isoform X1 [Cynara cardunculus var. scolymus]|uniref:cytochrome c oxidase assembly protein COX19-like isoform X1 n=1 Tax=Cynara cardunculus var. scolymus TaxID=59895 RepID=UPI000D62D32F|nr:cytochrome c oxidase assembly protein COX19-like isoform X1 [Cynara cardunculus var. scolymus]
MSAGGAFGGNRGARPVPPEKGVFPLDHMHLCDMEKKEYISCLKTSGHKSEICRHLSKKYLECRMAKLEFDGEARYVGTRFREGRQLRNLERGKRKWKDDRLNIIIKLLLKPQNNFGL